MKLKIVFLSIVVAFLIPVSANADTLKTWDDGTVFVQGEVTGRTHGCEVDGACSLILNVNGHRVALVYAEGDRACRNMQAVEWVSGKHGENDPLPGGVYTKKFFEKH